jgi:hypothetical protein
MMNDVNKMKNDEWLETDRLGALAQLPQFEGCNLCF